MERSFKELLEQKTAETEAEVYAYLPEEKGFQKTIFEAMNYSVKAGGKRLRPLLMMETYRMLGGKEMCIRDRKNTAGAAAVLVLLFMAAVPVIKLLVLMFLYYMAAAVMQPVCDKRLVACMTGAAAGHGILLKIVGCSLALFSVTIAVLCASTNAVWYAG